MKAYIFILLLLCHFSSSAAEKQYESYEEIVQRLSSYRSQQLKSKLSTTVPKQKYHLSLGYSQNFLPIDFGNVGDLSMQGLSLGGAIPLVGQQLFAEAYGKFYQSNQESGYDASLKQFELRLAHKEPMSVAIVNFGVGFSSKFIDIKNGSLGVAKDMSIPSLLFLLGLERQLTSRVSLAGDILYHRSIRGTPDAKNSYEAVIRFNYNL